MKDLIEDTIKAMEELEKANENSVPAEIKPKEETKKEEKKKGGK